VRFQYLGLKGNEVGARGAGYGATNRVLYWQRLESVTEAKEPRAFQRSC